MRLAEKEFAFRQLATMLHGGLPLVAALETCGEQAVNAQGAALWRGIAAQINAGGMFSTALAATRNFDRYVVALAEVGESTGELERTLLSAAEYLERKREHRAMVMNALFYPVLVVLATTVVVWFMMVKVIPALKAFVEAQQRSLPAMTQLLIEMSDWTVAHGPRLAIIAASSIAALWLARRNDGIREATDALLFRLPVVGGILRLSATAVLSRSLALLLESGVTLLAALETVEGLFGNLRTRHILAEARRNVIRGGTLSETIRPHREFAPMLSRMASVGEATGSLGTTLADVARFHEERLRQMIRRLGMLMEPLLIVVVGTIVGFVYIAFFLAIFSLAGGR